MSELENGARDLPAIYNDDIVSIAERAEKRADAINKIKKASLKVTNSKDWTNQGGKPYLQVSGSEKVARLFGISWRIDEPILEIWEDGHFQYTYKGYFSMANIEIEAIGTRSSKDEFFSARYVYNEETKKKDKTIKPPSEIDRGDVKKGAYTNCIGNGITRLLGIRNMAWEDLEEAGIKKESVAGVDYGNKPEMSGEATGKKKEIGDMLMAMAGNDKDKAAGLLESLTAFTSKDGKEIAGKRSLNDLSEKAIPVTHTKVKAAYDKWQELKKNAQEGQGTVFDGSDSDN